jgi:hypothetical protein
MLRHNLDVTLEVLEDVESPDVSLRRPTNLVQPPPAISTNVQSISSIPTIQTTATDYHYAQ